MSYDDLMQVLGALESKVDTLTGTVQRLRVERDQLKDELSNTRHALQETENQLEISKQKLNEISEQSGSNDSFKDEVRQRIYALVEKIDQLEND